MTKIQPSPNDVRQLVSKLDSKSRNMLSAAADLAYAGRHVALDAEHIISVFFDLVDEPIIRKAVLEGFDVVAAKKGVSLLLSFYKKDSDLPPAISDQVISSLRSAWFYASLESQENLITTELFVGKLISNSVVFQRLKSDVPGLEGLLKAVESSYERKKEGDIVFENNSSYSNLAKYTVDLTRRAKQGEIDPVIGRETEISQVVEILLRRRQNNPILTGDAGVGKTAIVEGLAQRIASGLVPKELMDVQICSLDMGLLRAGASMRGDIESRMKGIISEISSSDKPIILFIDEAHTLVAGQGGLGEPSDIANLIKPELARGSLRTIAATTWTEYKRYFEKDAALSRRFQNVHVTEPTPATAQDILQALVPSLQKHHGVYVLQSAIKAAVQLSSRYIQGRQLPDKAISVLDTACARAVASLTGPANEHLALTRRRDLLNERLLALKREFEWGFASHGEIATVENALTNDQRLLLDEDSSSATKARKPDESDQLRVGEEQIASVIADWTGVPSQKMLQDQHLLAARLEEALEKRVVGQKIALGSICDGVRSYVAKLEDPSRPIGVFLLVGPSGSGKTETAHALADVFFGISGITVVNMSEYQEAHTVSKLKGAPAGYVGFGQGGVLTEAVRRQPYGILLLDEIEKAHPDVLDLFLQVFDKGFMEDSEGVLIDFKNILVLMTSNASADLLESVGSARFSDNVASLSIVEELRESLLKVFKPAFLGRSQIVPYFPLSENELRSIVKIKFDVLARRFESSYGADLTFAVEVLEKVVSHCSSSSIGARWIDQFISENILSLLSAHILGLLAAGSKIKSVHFSLIDGEFQIRSDSN